jgi:hypothetical protein
MSWSPIANHTKNGVAKAIPRPATQYRSMSSRRPGQVSALAVADPPRPDGRFGQELPYLLRTAAGNGDLGSPLECLLA